MEMEKKLAALAKAKAEAAWREAAEAAEAAEDAAVAAA